MKKLTTEEFIAKAKKVHGDKYDYSLVEYKTSKIKIKIICKEHGIFEQEPHSHLNGNGCRLCTYINKKEYIKKAKNIHGDKYDYSLVFNIKTSINIKIICSIHGIFEQLPSNHLRGNGCPLCSKENKYNNTFKTKCDELGVNYYSALKRRQAGLSDEMIFKKGYIRNERKTTEIVVYGKTFNNLRSAIRFFKPQVSQNTITRRINSGMSIEEAFEKLPNNNYSNGIIYMITNKITNKVYIGLTIQALSERWNKHIENANKKTIKNEHSLHEAIRKYGKDSFEIEVIHRCTSKSELVEMERYYIQEYNSVIPNGYNITNGGEVGGGIKKKCMVDGIIFDSVKEAEYYISDKYNISQDAASKRIYSGNLDCKTSYKRTDEELQEIANKYKTRSDFRKNEPNPCAVAKSRGIMDKLFENHYNNGYSVKKNGYWTFDKLQEEANKYKTRGEFQKYSTAYSIANKKGLIDKLFEKHKNNGLLINKKPWNKKYDFNQLQVLVNNCETRAEFCITSKSAYNAALNLKIMDELFKNHPNQGYKMKQKKIEFIEAVQIKQNIESLYNEDFIY